MYIANQEMAQVEQLQKKASAIGFILSSPQTDMYGRYECSIEDPRTGATSVAMNCDNVVEAARRALNMRMPEAVAFSSNMFVPQQERELESIF